LEESALLHVFFSVIFVQQVLLTVLDDNLDTAAVPVVPFEAVFDVAVHVFVHVELFWHPVVDLLQQGFVVVVGVVVLLLSLVVTVVVVVVEVWA
jgi:hypothetical protein